MLRVGSKVACMACRNLVSTNMGVRFRVPLQKLHPLSRAIHHRYSANANPQRPPHRTAARHFTSMSRLPMRPPKPPPGSGGYGYQQQRGFWVARLAARLLRLRYILLGSAVGGGYTAKKTYDEWKDMLPDFSEYNWVIPDFVWELSEQIDFGFPPDILHDLFEGVVPVELAHCLKGFPNTVLMATDVLKLRVILDDINAERLILPSRPETVQALISEMKDKLNLTYDFRLQFEDPEFNNALNNLANMEDLPAKATIKIVRVTESDLSSTSTDDTVLLSDNTNSPERLCRWPAIFVVPAFSYEVEYVLREGNSALGEGKTFRLTRDQKHNILEVMAAEIYKHKAYPSTKQIGLAAEALVSKYPCLKENGSKKGYEGWQNSLRFKMGNYRTKLSKAGIKDVAVNARKRSRINPEGAASRASIKRPRRGEINFLPNYPQGETRQTLEMQRLAMVEQFKRTSMERDMVSIQQHMQRTFALRREEIVDLAPPVVELKDRWPALFCEAQLYSEFHRITNLNLPSTFYASLDKYTPQLLQLYKKRKTGTFGQKMDAILMAFQEQDKNDICAARTTALAGLPHYLKEDSAEVFRTCKEDDLEATQEGAMALVAVVNQEEVLQVPFETQHVSIVLEDMVVMSHRSWTDSLVILFALVYALHLKYPEKLSGFFEFIQVILLDLDDGRKQLRPKLQALKNELE